MATSASDTMRSLGILQEGDTILRQTARPFDFPTEAEDARRVVAELNSAAERVSGAHIFGKGMGIAAPQIGIDRAAIVKTPGGGKAHTRLCGRQEGTGCSCGHRHIDDTGNDALIWDDDFARPGVPQVCLLHCRQRPYKLNW